MQTSNSNSTKTIVRQICKECVNDPSIPNISFNSEDVCIFCEDFKKLKPIISDYDTLKKLWFDRISKYKGQAEYDAFVGLSGGKDSTYVLYNLINTYGLKVKAWTIDHGFLTKLAKERIENIIGELGVDHEYTMIKKEELKRLYQFSIMASGTPCQACYIIMYGNFIKKASEEGIPMAIHGASRPQLFKILSNENNKKQAYWPLLEMALTPIENINISDTYEKVWGIYAKNMSIEILNEVNRHFPDYTSKSLAEFVPYFLYHPYDENKIVQFLELKMNWKRHHNYDTFTHFDCAVHDAAMYLFELTKGRSFIMSEISVSIREGTISRDDAIKRMKEEKFNQIPIKSLQELSNYVGINVRSLTSNAKRKGRKTKKLLLLGQKLPHAVK